MTTCTPDSEVRGGRTIGSDARPEFCARLGHTFVDDALFDLSVRHRSWCAEHGGVESNERLEFLGDAVLGVVVTDFLFRQAPGMSEGVLARRRSELVNATTLARVARRIGLGEVLALGRGEDITGGRDKTSILADAMEAVFGAVYLDGGAGAATHVILDLLADDIDGVLRGERDSDHKSRLQELAAQRSADLPRYELSETGPEHDKRFTATVTVAGVGGSGTGRTKKEAEQAAAREAAEHLLRDGDPVSAPRRATDPIDHAPGGDDG